MTRPFGLRPLPAAGAALLRPFPGLSDYYTGSRGRRRAGRRTRAGARGLVIAARRPSGGRGPAQARGWLTFDVAVDVDGVRHDVNWTLGNRPRWIAVDDGEAAANVVVRLFTITAPDPELRVKFELPPGSNVLLVEVRPRILGDPRGAMPPSVRVRDANLQVVAEQLGSPRRTSRRTRRRQSDGGDESRAGS